MRHPLQTLRDYYLNCFGESVKNASSRFDQFTTELLLELPSLKYAEYCHRLYRADIIGKRAGEPGMLEVNVMQKKVRAWRNAFPPTVRADGPMVWNGIEFRVADVHPPEAELLAWASSWLDVSDSRYDESAPFQQVVHNITPPRLVDGGYVFSVDFGSAPTLAFDELIEIVARGSARVSIGSYQG